MVGPASYQRLHSSLPVTGVWGPLLPSCPWLSSALCAPTGSQGMAVVMGQLPGGSPPTAQEGMGQVSPRTSPATGGRAQLRWHGSGSGNIWPLGPFKALKDLPAPLLTPSWIPSPQQLLSPAPSTSHGPASNQQLLELTPSGLCSYCPHPQLEQLPHPSRLRSHLLGKVFHETRIGGPSRARLHLALHCAARPAGLSLSASPQGRGRIYSVHRCLAHSKCSINNSGIRESMKAAPLSV